MATLLEIKTDFVELAKAYAGQWVAIDPDTNRVVASGSTAMQVFELAKQAGVSDPIITGVSDDYGAYVPCLTV
ncbi:MAG: hypothetical protein HY510_08265 [Acidobacteria bacterium]|nr:hypothetical protein [Acidobacteriota bacterium]